MSLEQPIFNNSEFGNVPLKIGKIAVVERIIYYPSFIALILKQELVHEEIDKRTYNFKLHAGYLNE